MPLLSAAVIEMDGLFQGESGRFHSGIIVSLQEQGRSGQVGDRWALIKCVRRAECKDYYCTGQMLKV